jgi:PIN domain nuclease of toxin-antitoxin system
MRCWKAELKFLLDTHVLLWAIDQPKLLSPRVRKALLDETNELHASVVSVWEISLKVEAGKLRLPDQAGFLADNFRKLGVQGYLPLELLHVHQLAKLPPIHKDPFDRILLAQAMVEGWTLVSKDANLAKYPGKVFW